MIMLKICYMSTPVVNNEKALRDAILLSLAISEMKNSSPDDYKNLKEALKTASKGLTEISNAIEDDYISPEEAEAVRRIFCDPLVRKLIENIFPSSTL